MKRTAVLEKIAEAMVSTMYWNRDHEPANIADILVEHARALDRNTEALQALDPRGVYEPHAGDYRRKKK